MTALLILEGPELTHHETKLRALALRGWRHYQFVSRNKVSTCVGQPERTRASALSIGASFYAAGTWEDETKPVPPNTMPVPRPEILAQVHPKNEWQDQMAFA